MLVYVSSMAAMVWFVILAYAWHMSFQAIGKIQDRIDKKGAYFHLIAWCLPLALAVIVMAIAEVDGDSMTGICFVGYINYTARIWFLLVPLSIATLAGTYFLFRGNHSFSFNCKKYYLVINLIILTTNTICCFSFNNFDKTQNKQPRDNIRTCKYKNTDNDCKDGSIFRILMCRSSRHVLLSHLRVSEFVEVEAEF